MTEIKPKAFPCYLDNYTIIKHLSDADAGKLWKYLFCLANDDEEAVIEDNPLLSMAYDIMSAKLKKDLEAYERKVISSCENGKKGGRPPKPETQENPRVIEETQENPSVFEKTQKTQYKDKYKYEDKDKDEDEDKEKEKKEKKKKEKENAFGGYSSAAAAFCGQVIDLFNDNCVSLPRAEGVSEDRIMCLQKTRAQFQDLNYAELFDRVERSDFLTGRNGKWNGCTFDWLIRPDTVSKILNGNYDNREEPVIPTAQPPSRHTSYDIRELEKIDTLDWIDV
jgi:hypothetical protein